MWNEASSVHPTHERHRGMQLPCHVQGARSCCSATAEQKFSLLEGLLEGFMDAQLSGLLTPLRHAHKQYVAIQLAQRASQQTDPRIQTANMAQRSAVVDASRHPRKSSSDLPGQKVRQQTGMDTDSKHAKFDVIHFSTVIDWWNPFFYQFQCTIVQEGQSRRYCSLRLKYCFQGSPLVHD